MADTAAHDDRDPLYRTIDEEARDERESQESKLLYEALVARKEELAGGGKVGEDPELAARIHREAEKRSAEISAYRQGHAGEADTGAPIPPLLILAWGAVLLAAAVITAIFFWHS